MFDDIDSQLITRLTRNGRLSLTELSTHVNISRVAVANRIEKLVSSNMLRVSAAINLNQLNYQTLVIELQIDNKKENDFRRNIAHCGKVLHAFELTGNYNHLLICTSKNNSELRTFVDCLKSYAQECRVTLASNPQVPAFAQLKVIGDCACSLCGGKNYAKP